MPCNLRKSNRIIADRHVIQPSRNFVSVAAFTIESLHFIVSIVLEHKLGIWFFFFLAIRTSSPEQLALRLINQKYLILSLTFKVKVRKLLMLHKRPTSRDSR